jgi:hypothetical protein
MSTEYTVSNIPHSTVSRNFSSLILLRIHAYCCQSFYINCLTGSSEIVAVLSTVQIYPSEQCHSQLHVKLYFIL